MENLSPYALSRQPHFRGNDKIMHKDYFIARKKMVELQVVPMVRDKRVLEAMLKIPREKFVPDGLIAQAYLDRPVNIGEGQTISQPLIVGMMTEQLRLTGKEKILEIGTGSGYQCAILCELAKHVYSVERISSLSNRARKALYGISKINFTLRVGDGTKGWPENAPYDRIIVTAGAPVLPGALIEQLAEPGILVIPVGGEESQVLKVIVKEHGKVTEKNISGCRFVKLIGEQGWTPEK